MIFFDLNGSRKFLFSSQTRCPWEKGLNFDLIRCSMRSIASLWAAMASCLALSKVSILSSVEIMLDSSRIVGIP